MSTTEPALIRSIGIRVAFIGAPESIAGEGRTLTFDVR